MTAVGEQRLLPRLLDRLALLRSPSGAIYGTLVAATVLASEGDGRSVPETAAVVLVTVVVYWLSHGYAEMLPDRAAHMAGDVRVSLVGDFWRALRSDWPIVGGSFAMLFVLLVAGLAGATTKTAVAVALWFASAELFVWGALAARAARMPPRSIAAYACGSAVLGVLIAVLKTRLH